MERQSALEELCYLCYQRNQLQLVRRSARHRLYRAKKKLDKKKTYAQQHIINKLNVELFSAVVAIGEHVLANHKRICQLGKLAGSTQYNGPDNMIMRLFVLDPNGEMEYYSGSHEGERVVCIEREQFESYAKKYETRLAVESMLQPSA